MSDYWETEDERLGLLLNGAGIDLTLWDEVDSHCTRLTIEEFVRLVRWAEVVVSRFRRYAVVIERDAERREICLYATSPRQAAYWAAGMADPASEMELEVEVADPSDVRFTLMANGSTWGTVELRDVSRLPVGVRSAATSIGHHQDEADLDDLSPLLDCLEIARNSLALGETLAEKCDHPIVHHVQAAHHALLLPVSHLKRRVEEKAEDRLFSHDARERRA